MGFLSAAAAERPLPLLNNLRLSMGATTLPPPLLLEGDDEVNLLNEVIFVIDKETLSHAPTSLRIAPK